MWQRSTRQFVSFVSSLILNDLTANFRAIMKTSERVGCLGSSSWLAVTVGGLLAAASSSVVAVAIELALLTLNLALASSLLVRLC